ncbi:MAG: nitrile hydratase subunit beta [Chloroflexi bacterium]|nr:nitrile hydratase subunit beta [Chloroflexota bacterium]
MPKVHDRGGWPNDDPIDHDEHEMEEWERQVDALNGVLGEKGLKNTDQLRRAIESLDLATYESLAYYEKWTAAMETLLVEQGVMTSEEIDAKVDELKKVKK